MAEIVSELRSVENIGSLQLCDEMFYVLDDQNRGESIMSSH
jgi:hypothetical protein